MLSQFITGHYHLWFLYMIVGLYLLIPLLRPIAQSETLMRYFLLLALIFTFLLPQLVLYPPFISPQLSVVIKTVSSIPTAIFRRLHGIFCRRILFKPQGLQPQRGGRPLRCRHSGRFFSPIIAPVVHAKAQGAPSAVFYNYDSLNVLLTSVPIFVFAKQHLNLSSFREGDRQAKALAFVRQLSRYSFGVYLVHPMVIELLQHFGIDTFSCNAFFSVPLLAIFVFAASTAISALLNCVPIINKHFV